MNLARSTALLLRDNQTQLVKDATEKHLVSLDFTPAKRQAALRDANYNIQYLAEAIEIGSVRVFRAYIVWLRDILRVYGLPDSMLADHLSRLKESTSCIGEKSQQQLIAAYLDQGIEAMASDSHTSRSFIEDCGVHAALAERYLTAVLEARKDVAVQLILDALADGSISIGDLYTYVFTNVLYEIGRLWQTRKISVAQEHYVSAVTQYIITLAYDRVFAPGTKRHRILGVCIGDELHEIGIRMVCDIFELNGWDSHYLGANAPTERIISEVGHIKPDVLALSATLTSRISLCTETIAALKAHYPDLVIVVGGRAFSIDPDVWRRTGAHGYASNAVQAVALAMELVNRHD